jgi:hypothetical protein
MLARRSPGAAEQFPWFESMVRIAGDTIANARKSWYTMEAIAMQMSQPFTTEMTDDSECLCRHSREGALAST